MALTETISQRKTLIKTGIPIPAVTKASPYAETGKEYFINDRTLDGMNYWVMLHPFFVKVFLKPEDGGKLERIQGIKFIDSLKFSGLGQALSELTKKT